jgi:hypothetical protein
MLWKHYVFRRGAQVPAMWDRLFADRHVRLLYIAGRSFDVRAQAPMDAFIENVRTSGHIIDKADLLLVTLTGYQLSDDLVTQTERNAARLEAAFRTIDGTVPVSIKQVSMSSSAAKEEEDVSASNALRYGTERVLNHLTDHTDIILDVSSIPRIAYLALMTGLLSRLVTEKHGSSPLRAGGMNLQVLVAEDASLDSRIHALDPSNDLVLIPGFSSVLHAESIQDWPLVWFPILGENRVSQFQKIADSMIPPSAEICPVLPHPSKDLRRADRLLVEYKVPLFDTRQTPATNILYAHEANPFETYRQLFGAMERYRESMQLLGGCRLVVTPLASKLITLGAGLACFELRPSGMDENYGVAIPLPEPMRYQVSIEDLRMSRPEIAALLLTGDAYS